METLRRHRRMSIASGGRGMIKGRYVAQIDIDFQYDGDKEDYEMIHEMTHGEWLDNEIVKAVSGIFNSDGEHSVIVTKKYACVEDQRFDVLVKEALKPWLPGEINPLYGETVHVKDMQENEE